MVGERGGGLGVSGGMVLGGEEGGVGAVGVGGVGGGGFLLCGWNMDRCAGTWGGGAIPLTLSSGRLGKQTVVYTCSAPRGTAGGD